MAKTHRPVDFTTQDKGVIILIEPHSREAHQWVSDHIPDEVMRFRGAVVVEPQYIADILDDIKSDGLEVW